MMRRLCFFWLLSGGGAGLLALPAAGQARILFIGNSFTHGKYAPVLNYNAASVIDENFGLPPNSPRHQFDPTTPGPWGGIPGIFKKFADQAGLNYQVHIEAINGATLEYHEAYALSVVQQRPWDKVVLQELTTRPLPVARTGQPSLFIEYATRLEVAVHAGNPAAHVYLFQHWARADLTYPANKPYSGLPIDSMTQDLHSAFYRLAAHNPRFAAVVPIGDAWLRAIRAGVALRDPYNPTPGLVNLWNVDHLYPSSWGAYLAASVLFGQLTGRDPRTLGGAEQAAADLGISPAVAVALQQVAYQQVFVPGGVITAAFSPAVAAGLAAVAPVSLYPNPARERLFIKGPAATVYRVRNCLGQLLRQGLMPAGQATVELAGLPGGLYQLELETAAGRVRRTFVRE